MITINSFGTELNKDDRAKLYPKCGQLFPDGLSKLAKAEDYDQVRAIADCYGVSKLIVGPLALFVLALSFPGARKAGMYFEELYLVNRTELEAVHFPERE